MSDSDNSVSGEILDKLASLEQTSKTNLSKVNSEGRISALDFNCHPPDTSIHVKTIPLNNKEKDKLQPEVKTWLLNTFSHLDNNKDHEDEEEQTGSSRFKNALKKISTNVFGKGFLFCCCCLKCCMGEEKVQHVAKRITIATSPKLQIYNENSRRLSTNVEPHHPQFDENKAQMVRLFHSSRLRENLSYPNNTLLQKYLNSQPRSCMKKKKPRRSRPRILVSDPNVLDFKIPLNTQAYFNDHFCNWNFNIFECPTQDYNILKWAFCEVLTRYQLVSRFKIPSDALECFCDAMCYGYEVFENSYHNAKHATDVLQTVNFLIYYPGLLHWLTDLEIFALLLAAACHDIEHTGTTNDFHNNTKSELAILYNDRAPLENHHATCLFSLLEEPEANICKNMGIHEYRELRSLVVELILGTDMRQHFSQLLQMEDVVKNKQELTKRQAMTLILHSADISNPTKPYHIHEIWTSTLLEEFFAQGDDEIAMGLPASPMMDRTITLVPQSQIGFINIIVDPCFKVLHNMFNLINEIIIKEHGDHSDTVLNTSEPISTKSWMNTMEPENRNNSKIVSVENIEDRLYSFKTMVNDIIDTNKREWKKLQDMEQLKICTSVSRISE